MFKVALIFALFVVIVAADRCVVPSLDENAICKVKGDYILSARDNDIADNGLKSTAKFIFHESRPNGSPNGRPKKECLFNYANYVCSEYYPNAECTDDLQVGWEQGTCRSVCNHFVNSCGDAFFGSFEIPFPDCSSDRFSDDEKTCTHNTISKRNWKSYYEKITGKAFPE